MSERIGIVLVHGVGDQRRFEHLSSEALQIIRSLQADKNISKVSVQPRATQNSEYGAKNQTWLAEDGAPLQIDFLENGKSKSFFIHEVWWADLDNKITIYERIKFWYWTLGQWGYIRFNSSKLPGFQKMELPNSTAVDNLQSDFMVRLRLWAVGIVFLMAMVSLVPLSYLMRRIGIKTVGPDIFYQYLGDVKLYQDFKREEQGNLTDVGHPPRVPIRRRMIRVLIDAYFADYDRWYILAHTLGTVVAWNGLMETAHCLPNYLDEVTWKRCLKTPLAAFSDGGAVDIMRPSRPFWVKNDSASIRRDLLFSKLRGLVTYGSPLDKFAYLWGAIVPINPDKNVFHADFEWLNVFDHTDPVAAELNAYNNAPIQPKNYAYKASPFLLLSHIQYLTFRSDKIDCFVNRLNRWMLDKTTFAQPTQQDSSWDNDTRFSKGLLIRGIWWSVVTIVMALFLGWSVAYIYGGNMLLYSLVVLIVSVAIVSMTGMFRLRFEKYLNEKLEP